MRWLIMSHLIWIYTVCKSMYPKNILIVRLTLLWVISYSKAKSISFFFVCVFSSSSIIQMSWPVTKPTIRRGTSELRSACAFVQSDQSLHWLHVPSIVSRLSKERKAKTPVILGGCAGWSESNCRFCGALAQMSEQGTRITIFTLITIFALCIGTP